uniref:Zinc finger protein 208-like n=1 Tax=Pundamilia nyererei TaxID=303518 RepID=A0A3B4FAN2_9CICH
MKAHCRQHRLRETNSCSAQTSKQAPAAEQEEVRGPGKENAHQSEEPKRTFNCPLCPQTYCAPANLRAHMLIHEAEYEKLERSPRLPKDVNKYWDKGHTCPHCPSIYRDESSLNVHLLSVHKSVSQYLERLAAPPKKQFTPLTSDNVQVKWKSESISVKSYKCSECGKTFRHRSVLELHMRIHSKDKPYQCKVCGKGFRFSSYLQQHLIIHTGKKPYKCSDCGKDFAFLQNMRTHQKLHQEKPFRCVPGSSVACPVCGRKFRHRGIMTLHMRKHENGNHKCELCNRSFRLFSSLLRHQVVHNDHCPDCGKLFSRAKALQFHMKSHGYESGHSPSSSWSRVTLEDLQCATCLAHFNSKVSLRVHQKLCIKRDNQVVANTENDDALRLCEGSVDASTWESSDQSKVRTPVKSEMDGTEPEMENDTGEGELENPTASNMKYKCKKCDRSFSVVGALNFHKRIHAEGYRSLPKSKLAISTMLKKPKQEEQGKGLFHCSECGRRFMSNSALGSHKRWHKEKKSSRSLLKDDDLKSLNHKTIDGTFQCKNCGKQFFNHRVLQRHQMFNPPCQSKAVPEPDLSSNEPGKTFVQDSLPAKNSKTLETGNEAFDQAPEQVKINCTESDAVLLALKPKPHQCPLCSMTFTKARGLRAHKWQAHAKSTKGKRKAALRRKKDSTVDRDWMKITLDSPVKLCPDSREWGISEGPPNFKRVYLDVKQESKLDNQTPRAAAEVPPQVSCVSENTAKCFFKCDKCGKAFQTEEQLGTHKAKAQSRPYSCALCCQGFWTENQLHQHLAWHDEVRCRLPNEVRYRLSAAMTSKPLKPNPPTADNREKFFPSSKVIRPTLNSAGQSQSSHKCQHCAELAGKIGNRDHSIPLLS